MDAHESMMAAPGYTTVREEFGRPAPTFLDDMLAEGRRADAARRAEAELLKKAQRLWKRGTSDRQLEHRHRPARRSSHPRRRGARTRATGIAPTDRELLLDTYQSMMDRPQRIGFCFEADGRRARFLVDEGSRGDQLLDLLARHHKTPARPVRPYGVKGWLVEG